MGFFDDLLGNGVEDLGDPSFVLDPLDFSGRGAGESAREAARLQSDASLAAIGENQRQFDQTTGNLQPFLSAGLEALPRTERNATLGGFSTKIANLINGGTLDPLVDERLRTVRNEASRAGLRRSGEGLSAIADVPTNLIFEIESMLSGRQDRLAGAGQNAAARLGGFGAENSRAVSGLLQDSGDALAQGIMNQSAARAQGNQNLANIGTGLLSLFSDPRLKENVKAVGEHNGMTLYEWDWIPEAPDFVKEQVAFGFMADEVLEKRPDLVDEFAGFLTVNYPELLW